MREPYAPPPLQMCHPISGVNHLALWVSILNVEIYRYQISIIFCYLPNRPNPGYLKRFCYFLRFQVRNNETEHS